MTIKTICTSFVGMLYRRDDCWDYNIYYNPARRCLYVNHNWSSNPSPSDHILVFSDAISDELAAELIKSRVLRDEDGETFDDAYRRSKPAIVRALTKIVKIHNR